MSLPQLPIELLYNILEKTWSSTLTPAERVQFMTASRLVSKTWFAVYDDVFSEDIHVPSKSSYFHLFNDPTRDFSRCKRITFTVCGGLLPNGSDPLPPRSLKFMSSFDMKKLTSLHALNIVYYNAAFPDPCAQGFFLALPDYLPKLTVSYTFSPDIPPNAILLLRKSFNRSYKTRYAEPQVGTLEVNGADEFIAAIWESLFPKRGKLFRDGKEENQRLIPVQTVFDRRHAWHFLLKNFLRQREYYDLHSSHYGQGDDEALRSPHASVTTTEEELEPPKVSRSPTERSLVLISPRIEQRKEASQDKPLEVHEVEVHGLRVLSATLLAKHLPTFSWPSVSLGDIGYTETSTGTFSTLFNAFEPHIVGGTTIPSLYGYGAVQVRRCKHDQDRDISGMSSYGSSTTNSDSNSKVGERGVHKAKKAVGSIFKAASGRVGAGKWKSRTKNAEFKFLDRNVAELWFKSNMDKIIGIYGDSFCVSQDNLVFVTGSFT